MAYRSLLLPIGATWISAGSWQLGELRERRDAALVWGEVRVGSGVGTMAAVRRALARELALGALRLGVRRGDRALRVHRLGSDGRATGSPRQRLRRRLRGGTLVELAGDRAGDRPLDRVASSAGFHPVGPPIVGAGGGVVQRGTRAGVEGILRVGLDGDVSDPVVAAAALERLAVSPPSPVPRLLDRGQDGAVTWSLETALAGRCCTALSPQVWAAVRDAWAHLPRDGAPPRATSDDLRRLARALPHHASRLEAFAATVEEAVGDVRGILAHRDLWPGNVLVQRGQLSGVIDWGSWRPDALPGADLLQLYVGGQRQRRREPLGPAWLRRPWQDRSFWSGLRDYWQSVDVEPSRAYLETLGLAWWAAEVAGTFERVPARRRDRAWLATNVERVLATTAASPPGPVHPLPGAPAS